jgi:hypothetical protein
MVGSSLISASSCGKTVRDHLLHHDDTEGTEKFRAFSISALTRTARKVHTSSDALQYVLLSYNDGWLLLLFFAADYQPWTLGSRRNPGHRQFGEQKNSYTLAVQPLFSADLCEKQQGSARALSPQNNSLPPLDEIRMPGKVSQGARCINFTNTVLAWRRIRIAHRRSATESPFRAMQ